MLDFDHYCTLSRIRKHVWEQARTKKRAFMAMGGLSRNLDALLYGYTHQKHARIQYGDSSKPTKIRLWVRE